jgi:ABC transporter substrate binding protein
MSGMRRRDFVSLIGGAAAWPLAARAQQRTMPVIGYLSSASPTQDAGRLRGFRQGLRETGYVEGQNVAIEYRWAEEQTDRLPALAADLVSRKVSVIAMAGQVLGAFAAKAATKTIPVVFLTGADPVAIGLVASLNRPGGNLTGVTTLSVELEPKRLELLQGLVPTATTIGALVNPTNPNAEIESKGLQAAARALGLNVPIRRQYRARFRYRLRQIARIKGRRSRDRDRRTFHQPKRTSRRADGPPWRTCDLSISRIRCRRGLDELWRQPCGHVPSVRGLRRPYPQGREAGRLAGPAGNESRADHQSQDRQSARADRPAAAHRPRRRGDRVSAKMKRREFITLLGGAVAAWPLAARAQQPGMPVGGIDSALESRGLSRRKSQVGTPMSN